MAKKPTMVFYGIYDPALPDICRYVGKTFRFSDRASQHRTGNGQTSLVTYWERLLRRNGRTADVRILDTMDATGQLRPGSGGGLDADFRRDSRRREIELIQRAQAEHPYMLNCEGLVFAFHGKPWPRLRSIESYGHLLLGAMHWCRDSLSRAMELERIAPECFYVLHIGDLHKGLLDGEKQGCKFSGEAASKETWERSNRRNREPSSIGAMG